ncbi:DDE-type integrase/transposase/recombinase [Nocardia amamiensis]
MYGRRKMAPYLRRQGHQIGIGTVDRLMRDEGLSGVVRCGKHRTTIAGKGAGHRRAPDLVDRDFTAAEPNRKWVTDFTYVPTWSGFVYVAFVIDCFSRSIVGWQPATIKDTVMVTTALRMALWRRDHDGHAVDEGLIHHSDAGSQLDQVRGNPCRRRNRGLDRQHRRCLRQRPGGVDDRAVQDRGRCP